MRELQTLRASDGARAGVSPGSILADYVAAYEREIGFEPPPREPPTSVSNAIAESLLDAAIRAKAALLTTRLQAQGFPLSDTVHWTRDLSLHTTNADTERTVRWATAFRNIDASQAEARQWWNTFTSLHWSLRYRARRHTPESARDTYYAIARHQHEHERWTTTLLQSAHAWTMTGLPVDRVSDYLQLRVTPREALHHWEPREDRAQAIAVMLALRSRANP